MRPMSGPHQEPGEFERAARAILAMGQRARSTDPAVNATTQFLLGMAIRLDELSAAAREATDRAPRRGE